jgi:hypothetical protein
LRSSGDCAATAWTWSSSSKPTDRLLNCQRGCCRRQPRILDCAPNRVFPLNPSARCVPRSMRS